ncbi:GntR family transcriptional regulator [Ancylobacter mangrovi]|uniref:GntR family transcriptional regulator n=1 Tax=Ancylobacter mangrovi TaxID=2972472 RepID=UPI002163C656|nr:GntR family transcriptional regulator [Ancylobacter mangrovi]MCS0502869.1 GntR family transcriptional regulator [Ancylobacter mangrovi]
MNRPDFEQADAWIATAPSSQSESFLNAVLVIRRIVAEHHDRPSLVSRVACEVGAEIVENIRQSGEDLSSVELAERYETSRTPIREALLLLEKEGLVRIPQRRRPHVAVLDIAEAREIYRVRAVLFGAVASDAARLRTDADLESLREQLARLSAAHDAHDLSAYLWANVEFYNRLTMAAYNNTAKRILDSLLLRTLRLRRLSLTQPTRRERSMAHHVQLLAAIEEQDAPLADVLIRSNHLHALAALEQLYADGGVPLPMRSRRRRRQAAAAA